MAAEDWIPDYAFEDIDGFHEDDPFDVALKTCRHCGVTGLVWRESTKNPGKFYLATPAGNRHQCKRANIDREIDKFFRSE